MPLRGFLNAALTILVIVLAIIAALVALIYPHVLRVLEQHPASSDAVNFAAAGVVSWLLIRMDE